MNEFNRPFGYNTYPTATQPFGYPMNYMGGNYNQQNQPQQNQPQMLTSTNKIFVNSIEDVRNYYVPQGGDVMFVNKNTSEIYDKVVDNNGTVNIRTFELKEKFDQNGNFVSIQEFNALKKEIAFLKEQQSTNKTEQSNATK